MIQTIQCRAKAVLRISLSLMVWLCVFATAPRAQDGSPGQMFDHVSGATEERYEPTLWIDPDGCEHWVMDDGFEGYMTPHVRRDGTPVCYRRDTCGIMKTDQFFASASVELGPSGKARMTEFFQTTPAESFMIIGHTDNRASDTYSLRLSERRARAVAEVAEGAGVKVARVRGMGAQAPVAGNETAAGMAANRRVDIICLR